MDRRDPLSIDRLALAPERLPGRRKRGKKQLKKLEKAWDGRNRADATIPDYSALSDEFCVFTRGEAFRKHFTEMVGSNSLELLEQSRPRLDAPSKFRKQPNLAALPAFELPLTSVKEAKRSLGGFQGPNRDDLAPGLYAAWGEKQEAIAAAPAAAESLAAARAPSADPLLYPPRIDHVDRPETTWADPGLGPKMDPMGPPQIAVRVRGASGPLGFVEYDVNDTLRDLRKTLLDADMVPRRKDDRSPGPARFAFAYADGQHVAPREEANCKVKSFGAHVFVNVFYGQGGRVSPLTAAAKAKMRSKDRGTDGVDRRVTTPSTKPRPTPKISAAYARPSGTRARPEFATYVKRTRSCKSSDDARSCKKSAVLARPIDGVVSTPAPPRRRRKRP